MSIFLFSGEKHEAYSFFIINGCPTEVIWFHQNKTKCNNGNNNPPKSERSNLEISLNALHLPFHLALVTKVSFQEVRYQRYVLFFFATTLSSAIIGKRQTSMLLLAHLNRLPHSHEFSSLDQGGEREDIIKTEQKLASTSSSFLSLFFFFFFFCQNKFILSR